MADDYEVIIIGSGVAGAIMAWQLALQGRKVLLLESGPPVDRATAAARFARHEDPSETYPAGPDQPRFNQPEACDCWRTRNYIVCRAR